MPYGCFITGASAPPDTTSHSFLSTDRRRALRGTSEVTNRMRAGAGGSGQTCSIGRAAAGPCARATLPPRAPSTMTHALAATNRVTARDRGALTARHDTLLSESRCCAAQSCSAMVRGDLLKHTAAAAELGAVRRDCCRSWWWTNALGRAEGVCHTSSVLRLLLRCTEVDDPSVDDVRLPERVG